MSDDFETRLARLLNEQVDHESGPRRTAPPFGVRTAQRRRSARRAPWTMPLLAAACVAAVVAGGVGVSALVADSHGRTDVGPSPTQHLGTTPPTNAPTGAATPTGTPTSTPTSVQSSAAAAARKSAEQAAQSAAAAARSRAVAARASATSTAPTFVMIDGARVAVPAGWVMNGVRKYKGDRGYFITDDYCFNPIDEPGFECAVTVTHIRPPTGRVQPYQGFDVDALGLGVNPPPDLCNSSGHFDVEEQGADATFGGRQADYRAWKRSCNGNVIDEGAHYVATGAPGWAIEVPDAPESLASRFLTAFQTMASESVLPARSSNLRLMDRGIIRSVAHSSAGTRITIDRVWRLAHGTGVRFVNDSSKTYSYLVPDHLFNANLDKVGQRVYIGTDGSKVIVFRSEYI